MQLEEIFFWSYVYLVLEVAIIALWGLGAIYSLRKITKYRNMFLCFLGCFGMFLLKLGDNLLAIPETLFFAYEGFEKILPIKWFVLSVWDYMSLYYQREGLTILLQVCIVFGLAGRFIIKEKPQEQEQKQKQEKLVEVIIETDDESEITSFDVTSRDLDDLEQQEYTEDMDSQESTYDSHSELDEEEYTEDMDSQESTYDSQELEDEEEYMDSQQSDVTTYDVSRDELDEEEYTEDMDSQQSDVTSYDAASHEIDNQSDTFYDAASHELISDDDEYSDEYDDVEYEEDPESSDGYEDPESSDGYEDPENSDDYEEDPTFCDVPSEEVAPEMVEDEDFDAVSAQMEAVPDKEEDSNIEHLRALNKKEVTEPQEKHSLLKHVISQKKLKKPKRFDKK